MKDEVKMKKVTIILPVYNAENYLKRCIDSILNQTYKDFEIMIINDGSKDSSYEIMTQYEKKYPEKIKVINQENKGVAKTRNESIERADSKYIMFIDNDDYIDNDYLETYARAIEKEDYDIVVGGFRRPNENGKIVKQLKLKNEEWSKFMIMTPWAKIYKRKYLIDNNIKFLENNIGEDNYFNLKAFLMTKKIVVLDYIGYNWFFNSKSVSNTRQRNINNIQLYELLNSSYDMVKENKLLEENYEIIETNFIKYIIWIISYATKGFTYQNLSIEYDKIFNWLKERFPNYQKNRMISYTKPKGETLSSRIMTETFMLFHKIHLGKILIYLFNKI